VNGSMLDDSLKQFRNFSAGLRHFVSRSILPVFL
jgi:hypothetical protein